MAERRDWKADARRVEAAVRDSAQYRPSGWLRVNCPFDLEIYGKADTERTLSYNPKTTGYRCFRCGRSGFVLSKKAAETAEALGPPAGKAAAQENTEWRSPPLGFRKLDMPPEQAPYSMVQAWKYLVSRRLTLETVRAAGVGATAWGKYAQRVIIPVLADDGESWTGWCGRLWYPNCDRKNKYRFPGGMPRGEVIYNHAALTEETEEPVYLVEGAFDALAHWPHAVAVFGDITETQMIAMRSARRPIVVVLDGDAHQKGWALAQRLKFDGCRAGAVRLPPKMDPDQVPADWLYEEARKSISYAE